MAALVALVVILLVVTGLVQWVGKRVERRVNQFRHQTGIGGGSLSPEARARAEVDRLRRLEQDGRH